MQPIKVLIVVAGIAIGDQIGGAEQQALQIARRLKPPEFNTGVFSIWQYGSPSEATWREMLKREGILLYGMAPFKSGLLRQSPEIVSRFWEACNQFRPDVTNSHSQRGDPLCVLARYLHPDHAKAVRTITLAQPWVERPLLIAMQRVLYPFWFDAEVATSQSMQNSYDRRIMARLLGKRSKLIYNSINEELITHALSYIGKPLPPGVPLEGPRLAIVGRLTKQKGHADLLKAQQIVLQTRPVHLLVIGSGPLEEHLRRHAEVLGINPYVHFLGSRSDVFHILPHTSALISSSRWEGFPTVIMEAMALGVPVVATDIPGSCELVTHRKTGMLVPPENPQMMAQAILWLLSNEGEAQHMAQRARGSIDQYTIQNSASAHARLFLSLVKH